MLGQWLDAEVYRTTERPVPLVEYVVSADTCTAHTTDNKKHRKLAGVAQQLCRCALYLETEVYKPNSRL